MISPGAVRNDRIGRINLATLLKHERESLGRDQMHVESNAIALASS